MRAAASQTSPPYSFHAGAPVRSGVVNASTARGQVLTSICVVLSPVFVTVTTVWTVIGVVCEMVLRASKLRCHGPVELEHDATAAANSIDPTNLVMRPPEVSVSTLPRVSKGSKGNQTTQGFHGRCSIRVDSQC